MSVSCCRSVLYTVVETEVSTINRPPTCVIWLNENAYHKLIDILEKVFCQGVVRWLAKVLLNVWQKCYPTFDKSLFNVWQECFQMFDKDIIQRLIRVLSNV